MAMRYFFLDHPNDRWGDYGNTLVHGHGGIDEARGVFFLRRTGPFIPPFTQPFGLIVVTDSIRRQLEHSGLIGFLFVPVVKEKIVELNWQDWDRDLPEPEEFPESGEPEDYIDAGEHSPQAAQAMGELWALRIPNVARVERDRSIVASRSELHLVLDTTQGLDFVRSPDVGYCFVSERAKNWLQARVDEWVEFERVSVR